MKRKFWTSEKLLGLTAVFVSLLTLVVFIYQTNLIRQQQYMSVYPHLAFSNLNSGSLNYKYVLKNDGVGPAFISSIEIKDANGKKYNHISDYLKTKLKSTDSISLYNSDIFEGQLIPANKTIELYGLFNLEQTNSRGLPGNKVEGARKLRRLLNSRDLFITISYKSVYGERWSVTNSSEMPIKK